MPVRNTTNSILLAVAVASGACQSAPTNSSSSPVETITKAFLSGDGDAFASHYATPSAVVLSDATIWRAGELADRARSSGPAVRRWDLSSTVTHDVAGGSYMLGDSVTVIEPPNVPPIHIESRRLIQWAGAGANARIRADVSIPSRASSPIPADVLSRYGSLNGSWSEGDAAAARDHYSADSLFVLSNGEAHSDSGLDRFFSSLSEMNVSNLVDTPTTAWMGGEDGVFVAGTFSFQIPGESGPITISGCNLDVWKLDAGVWRIAVRVAQPQGSPTCLSDAS